MEWISVKTYKPKDLQEVNVTFVNHCPPPYYANVKDKPFTGTCVYYDGEWFWYSSTTKDVLAEYGRCDMEVYAVLNFENCDKCIFDGVPPYDIPRLQPYNGEIHKLKWIPFNYAKTCKNPSECGVHFYLDDYQFARLWNRPDDYLPLLSQFAAVCTPDFSQYMDMPVAMRLYNHYRKHWLGVYWQMHGLNVIPTICWSDLDSFAWCFDGEPTNGIISISSVGTQNSKHAQEAFSAGCREAIKRLQPTQILWYGKCPEEFDWNVVKIEPHYNDIVRRRKNGR